MRVPSIWRRAGAGAVIVAALLVTARAFAQAPPGPIGPPPKLPSVPDTQLVPPPPKKGPYLPVPPGATLVGEAKPSSDTGVDDRMFRSSGSYADLVRFYDRTLQQRRVDIVSRQVRPDGVTFTLRRPDGQLATVMVRNSRPPTIETREPL